jgi:hypothetical protein
MQRRPQRRVGLLGVLVLAGCALPPVHEPPVVGPEDPALARRAKVLAAWQRGESLPAETDRYAAALRERWEAAAAPAPPR